MNVTRICDFLRPALTGAAAESRYVEVRPARALDPDLKDRESQLPLCLMHPWEEEAGANRYDTIVSQRVAEQFAVITVCKLDELETHRDLLFATLLGAVLPTYVHEITYVRGATLGLDASVIWWRDIFITFRERRQS